MTTSSRAESSDKDDATKVPKVQLKEQQQQQGKDDSEWRKKLKMKSATPLKLGLCLDPKTVDDCTDLSSKKGRMWRIMRSKQMQQAYHRDPQKFEAWRDRIEHFYKRATWGATPEVSEESISRVKSAKRPAFKNAEEGASLPSKTLWHYYYHGGKTRAERRSDAIRRIAIMREEQAHELEERREKHKERLAKFAKRGLDRREERARRRKEQQQIRLPTLTPELLAEKAALEEQALLEKEAKNEAAIQIQAILRGGIARAQTRRMEALASESVNIPSIETVISTAGDMEVNDHVQEASKADNLSQESVGKEEDVTETAKGNENNTDGQLDATDEVATDAVATDAVATDAVATDEVATDEVATNMAEVTEDSSINIASNASENAIDLEPTVKSSSPIDNELISSEGNLDAPQKSTQKDAQAHNEAVILLPSTDEIQAVEHKLELQETQEPKQRAPPPSGKGPSPPRPVPPAPKGSAPGPPPSIPPPPSSRRR